MASRALILMATHNGMPYVREQAASVLSQENVDVSLVVADDASSDGTRDFLQDLSERDSRVQLIFHDQALGYPQNFLDLMTVVTPLPDQWVGFCDQDDTWIPSKLSLQLVQARDHGVAAVSSSITGVYEDGHTVLVRKDFPQRCLDFICESPGPGSTFLLSPEAFRFVSDQVSTHRERWDEVGFHDSLVYALIRAHGLSWHIDSQPTVNYRQHENNVMGINAGASARRKRADLLKDGWYRRQFSLLTKWSLAVATPEIIPDLRKLQLLLNRYDIVARLKLAWMCRLLRRRFRDRLLLAGGAILGKW